MTARLPIQKAIPTTVAFSERYWVRYFLIMLALLALLRAPAEYFALLFPLWKSRKDSRWLIVLPITLFLLLASSSLFSSGQIRVLRFPVMATAVLLGFQSLGRTPFLRNLLVFYSVLLLLVNFYFSQVVEVSLLKVVSWSLLSLGVFGLVLRVCSRYPQDSTFIFLALGTVSVLFSLLLIGLGLGTRTGGNFVGGMFSHSQTAGPVFAVVFVLLMDGYLRERKVNRFHLLIAFMALALVYLSHSRNAMLALVAGGVLSWAVLAGRGLRLPYPGRFWRLVGLVLVLFLLPALLDPGKVQENFISFVQKGDTYTTDLTELAEGSRGGLIERSMANFREYPLFGIGFGVGSDYDAFQRKVSGTWLVSASAEKGFLPSAVLEEQGLVGAVLFVLLLVHLVSRVSRYGSFTTLWILFATLLLNLGEAALFSMGPLGVWMWLMIAYAYAQSQPRSTPAPGLKRVYPSTIPMN